MSIRRVHWDRIVPREVFLMALLFLTVLCGLVSAGDTTHENTFITQTQPSASTPPSLIAVGYGRIPLKPGYSASQKKLMALRAAKLDAYRNLLAALQEISPHTLGSNPTVATDGFLQGVYLVREKSLGKNRYAVELGFPIANYSPQVLERFQTYSGPECSQQQIISFDEWENFVK